MAAPGLSSYPSGFAGGVIVRGVPLLQAHPGKVFWVYNGTALSQGQRGGSDGNRGTFDSPFSTIGGALAQCVSGRGDIIFLKAGHTETIINATAASTLWNVAGVAIIGLGSGAQRPTFTFTTANTATITVSAANISVVNCVFSAGFLSIATAITLTTAKYFTCQSCMFQDLAAATDFLNCITSTGAANTVDGLAVLDCQWYGLGVTSVNSMVLIADATINTTFNRNRATTERTADAAILLTQTTGAAKNIELGDNVVISKQTASTAGVLAKLNALSTGSVYRNYAGTLVTSADILFTTTVGVYPFDNRVTGVVGLSGFLIPATDA
jgi:hypothetical protein